ncbi:MAG TPA: dihydropteroate synthase [Methylomirabilota bacterium]|nr:dihydropteroate synthase [Methylomirabilota bacterium]
MVFRAMLGGLSVGDGQPVALIGVLNASPESFYQDSVYTTPDDLADGALAMVVAGAQIVDVGAMSTAPYLATQISEAEETQRLRLAVEAIAKRVMVPISVDTTRSGPATAGLEAGATIVNDVSGLKSDPAMAPLVAAARAGLLIMAHERTPQQGEPMARVIAALNESLEIARSAGIQEESIVVDPGIGFFRHALAPGLTWHQWDCAVLRGLRELETLGRPICVGASRKSFIGAVSRDEHAANRLFGSLAAHAIAVWNGAHLIRTHDVRETAQSVRVAQAIRGAQ